MNTPNTEKPASKPTDESTELLRKMTVLLEQVLVELKSLPEKI